MRRLAIALGTMLGLATIMSAQGGSVPQPPSGATALAPATSGVSSIDDPSAVFEQYCFECHGAYKPEANLSIEQLLATGAFGEHFEQWEKIADALESEVMPPLEASEAAFAAFEASAYGQNPLAQDDAAALELGQVMYERHCSVCHGTTGAGDGPVGNVYGPGFVPPLTSGVAVGRSDAYIYAVIRAGRARMPSYGARTTHLERWAIVNYVNSLQGGAAGAAPAGAVAPAQTDTTAATATSPQQQ